MVLSRGDKVVYLGFTGIGTGTSSIRESLKVNNIYNITDVDRGFIKIMESPEQWLLTIPNFNGISTPEYHKFENLKQNRKRKLKD